MGTFISIRQACSHCGHVWMWNSQPFIKNKPTGNILLSAAILFSGSTPTKALHFLNCLHVACITDRTFYLHQRQYIEPQALWKYCGSIVQALWNHKQQQLLSACELPLIIGGDGRADSPGHSAKNGSYGVIDLRTNKVQHI